MTSVQEASVPVRKISGIEYVLAALTAIWGVLISGWVVAGVVSRFAFNAVLPAHFDDYAWVSLYFILAIAMIGLVVVFSGRSRRGINGERVTAGMRLSVWPGIPVVLFLSLVLLGLVAWRGPASLQILPAFAFSRITQALESYTVLNAFALIFICSIMTRSHRSAAVLAAPLTLTIVLATVFDHSVFALVTALAIPALLYAVVTMVAALVTASKAPFFAPSLGALLMPLWAFMVLTGIFTPTEFSCLFALLLVPIAVFRHSEHGRAGVIAAFSRGGIELTGLAVAMVLAAMIGLAMISNAPALKELGEFLTRLFEVSTPAQTYLFLITIAVIAIGLAYIVTPVVALVLIGPVATLVNGAAGAANDLLMCELIFAALAGLHLRLLADLRGVELSERFASARAVLWTGFVALLVLMMAMPVFLPFLRRIIEAIS